MAQESDVSDVSRLSEDQLLKDLELIPLPGHFFQMIGIRTPDDTVFLADCLSSRATLENTGSPLSTMWQPIWKPWIRWHP